MLIRDGEKGGRGYGGGGRGILLYLSLHCHKIGLQRTVGVGAKPNRPDTASPDLVVTTLDRA